MKNSFALAALVVAGLMLALCFGSEAQNCPGGVCSRPAPRFWNWRSAAPTYAAPRANQNTSARSEIYSGSRTVMGGAKAEGYYYQDGKLHTPDGALVTVTGGGAVTYHVPVDPKKELAEITTHLSSADLAALAADLQTVLDRQAKIQKKLDRIEALVRP